MEASLQQRETEFGVNLRRDYHDFDELQDAAHKLAAVGQVILKKLQA